MPGKRSFIGRLLGGFDAQDKMFRINARYGVRDTFTPATQSRDVFQSLDETPPEGGIPEADINEDARSEAIRRERRRRQSLVHRHPEKHEH